MTLLYLDYDGELPPDLTWRIVRNCSLWGWPIVGVRIDRTRNGWHVIVGVRRRIEPALIVAAQAILGSHDKREAYNLMRVQSLDRVPRFWRARWNVLYSSHRKPPIASVTGNLRREPVPDRLPNK